LALFKEQNVQPQKHVDAELNSEFSSGLLTDSTSIVENDSNTEKIAVEDQQERDSAALTPTQARTCLSMNEDDSMQNPEEASSDLAYTSMGDILNPCGNISSDILQTQSSENAPCHLACTSVKDILIPSQNTSSDVQQTQNVEKIPSDLACISMHDILKPSENAPADVQQTPSPEPATLDPSNKVFENKEAMNKLRERQTILKESIDSSREANKELKYDGQVKDLTILVQRQQKMLKYHGYEISESKSSLQKCRKQLSEEERLIIVTENEIGALLKRKKVMESMVLSTTTKLIDCRRKRGVMSKRFEEENSN